MDGWIPFEARTRLRRRPDRGLRCRRGAALGKRTGENDLDNLLLRGIDTVEKRRVVFDCGHQAVPEFERLPFATCGTKFALVTRFGGILKRVPVAVVGGMTARMRAGGIGRMTRVELMEMDSGMDHPDKDSHPCTNPSPLLSVRFHHSC